MQTEQGILRLSILVTFALAAFGVVFGVLTGSSSIIFDGVYSALDASMTILALLVSRLITQSMGERTRARLVRHFTMGFWHLEPMVLGLSGFLLIGAAGYALANAVSSLLSGGRVLAFDHAILYAALTLCVALGMALFVRRANRRIGSAFLELDAKAWMISAAMTGALFVAFAFGWAIQGTLLAERLALYRPGGAGAGLSGGPARALADRASGLGRYHAGDAARPENPCR
jgi:predicted Co/Zn/Cd cation transporter (cation efflux family)